MSRDTRRRAERRGFAWRHLAGRGSWNRPRPFIGPGGRQVANVSRAKPEVLAIIPARRNSSGLPLKNIKPLHGKPLLAYSIDAALKARCIDRVVVSTEDQKIADIAKEHGAEVPFLRPKRLAGSRSLYGDAMQYTIDRMYYPRPNDLILVCLLPTSPFRPEGLVDFLTQKMIDGCTSAFTVRKVPFGRQTYYSLKGDTARPMFNPTDPAGGDAFYYRFYGVYSATRIGLTPEQPQRQYVHVLKDEISLVDIDTPADFALAEEIIRLGLATMAG
jgi:CMP-N,N'-diacetyllegionaminic acid synthase